MVKEHLNIWIYFQVSEYTCSGYSTQLTLVCGTPVAFVIDHCLIPQR